MDIRSKAAKGTVLDGLLKHWLRAQVMGRKYAKDSHEVNQIRDGKGTSKPFSKK